MIQVYGEGAFPGGDALFLQHANRLAGHGGSGVYHPHPGTGQPLYDRLEEGVMGAAQHYDIGPLVQKGLEGGSNGFFCFRAVQNTVFYQFHEAFPYVLYNVDVVFELAAGVEVLGALEGAGRGQNTYDAAFSAQRGRLNGRLHAYEGDIGIICPQAGDGSRRGGVAGHHDDIGPHSQEDVCDNVGSVLNIFGGFFSVGAMGIV